MLMTQMLQTRLCCYFQSNEQVIEDVYEGSSADNSAVNDAMIEPSASILIEHENE
jgi:hypothetical protein